ncbi:MAG TPA: hypothetical protein VN030_13945 [Cellvibrio sp.]|nr:hypothetical protein [Cellvibrio sp.]
MHLFKTTLLTLLLYFSLSAHAASATEHNFQAFWDKFKAASLANNYPELEKMIYFPLAIKGTTDDVPIKKYGKNDLRKIYPKLMQQTVSQLDSADKFIDMPFAELIKKIDKVDASTEDQHTRVEQFEFSLINNQWYLVSAYLEEQ